MSIGITEREMAAWERDIALMRAAGKTHIPMSLDFLERMISQERARRAPPTRVPFGGDVKAPPSLE